MTKDMPGAQELDGDDRWNDQEDVKPNEGYVLLLGEGYGFRKGYEAYAE